MKTFKQILLSIIAFITVLALCELFIRTTHLSEVSPNEFYEDIGRGRRKNLTYVYFNEGFGVGKFNNYRYIGEANPPHKDNNIIRSVLMGDSFVESFQVFERDYFGEIAENYLAANYTGIRFEMLNFGRSGFDIADIYAYQKIMAETFDPDFILYMLTSGDLEPKYRDPLQPQTIIVNDSLKITRDYDREAARVFEYTKVLTQRSSVINMINNARKRAKTNPFGSILFDKIYLRVSRGKSKDAIQEEKAFKYQLNPVTRKIIESLDPGKVIIVDCDMQGLPSEFREICAENDLIYFDLGKSLNLMKEQGIDPYEWKITGKSGHWNQEAQKVVGREIGMKLSNIIDDRGMISDGR